MKKILIGCPIFDRAWLLPEWIKRIEAQDYPKDHIGFVFELGPDDDATHDILWQWQIDRPEYKIFDAQIYMGVPHSTHPEGCRTWNYEKFYNMVELRNNLLERATSLADQFDYYFSLDSDIFLEDPQTLNKLVALAEDKSRSVLSPLMYMSGYETLHPSAMTWSNGPGSLAERHLEQYPRGEIFKADVVMAAVFMQKEVFTNVRYRFHVQGEDLGFAWALEEEGFDSYAAWSIYCPHIMHRVMLEDYLKDGYDARNMVQNI